MRSGAPMVVYNGVQSLKKMIDAEGGGTDIPDQVYNKIGFFDSYNNQPIIRMKNVIAQTQ
jgi:hypothetical protein